jgi:hypothetical protein
MTTETQPAEPEALQIERGTSVLDRELHVPRAWGFAAGAAILIIAALVGSFGLFARADRSGDITPIGSGFIAGSSQDLTDLVPNGEPTATGDPRLLAFGAISDIAIDSRGRTYIADAEYGLRLIEPESQFVSSPIERPGPVAASTDGLTPAVTPEQALYGAQYLTIAGDDNLLASSSTRVVKYDRLTNQAIAVAGNGIVSGGRVTSTPTPTEVAISPSGIALSSDNAVLYIADRLSNQLYVLNLVTNQMTAMNLQFPVVEEQTYALNQPAGIVLNDDNTILYVANEGAKQLLAIRLPALDAPTVDRDGNPIFTDVTILADETKVGAPHDLQFDPIDDTIWLTDTLNSRVLRYDLGTGDVAKLLYDPITCGGCTPSPLAEAGMSQLPLSLAFSFDYQAVFVGDGALNRITTYVVHTPAEVASRAPKSSVVLPTPDGTLQPVTETTGPPTTTIPEVTTTLPPAVEPEPTPTTVPAEETTVTTPA